MSGTAAVPNNLKSRPAVGLTASVCRNLVYCSLTCQLHCSAIGLSACVTNAAFRNPRTSIRLTVSGWHEPQSCSLVISSFLSDKMGGTAAGPNQLKSRPTVGLTASMRWNLLYCCPFPRHQSGRPDQPHPSPDRHRQFTLVASQEAMGQLSSSALALLHAAELASMMEAAFREPRPHSVAGFPDQWPHS